MKVEHREAIERAKLHGVSPMVLAHQLMVHDMVEAALFELRNIKTPFSRLSEENQQEVIDRITEQAEEVVWTAVGIISSRSVDTIPIKIADSKFKEKNITVTGTVDAQDPNRHGLIDLSGKLALLVLAPNDYKEGTDGIRAERDQRELPLSASEIILGAGLERRQEQQLDLAEQQAQQNPKSDSDEVATDFAGAGVLSKEFGDYDYAEATRLLIAKAKAKPFKAPWVQSQLAISSDQVSTLLLRLLDDKAIVVDKEGKTSQDHSYKIDMLLAEAG